MEFFAECSNLVLGQRITGGERNKQADSFHWRGLLRSCGKRPRDRCASDNNNKLPPPHICPQIKRGTVTANLQSGRGSKRLPAAVGEQPTDVRARVKSCTQPANNRSPLVPQARTSNRP